MIEIIAVLTMLYVLQQRKAKPLRVAKCPSTEELLTDCSCNAPYPELESNAKQIHSDVHRS